jgi:DNA-binding PadR family transcriptional regulator
MLHPFCRGRFGRRFAHRGFDADSGHFRGERHGRGRRGGRLFDHGDLRFVILRLIAEKPRHGYEIIKAIEDQVGGAYSPSPGVVYPTLTMLEELGYATVGATEGARKLYAATPEGLAFLDANRPAVDAVLARIDAARSAYGDGPAPQIVRAMENLRLALRLRLRRGPLTEVELQAITTALDGAATTIERS